MDQKLIENGQKWKIGFGHRPLVGIRFRRWILNHIEFILQSCWNPNFNC